MNKKFNVALCQLSVVPDKNQNIQNAVNHINEAAAMGANIVILPEMFNCPYDNTLFSDYAEAFEESITLEAMAKAASKNGIYLAAGSIPEKDGSSIYNTCFVFDRTGKLIGRHRKMHLFDVEVKGGISFKESEKLTAGNAITVIDTELCRIGVAICYDIRFPELMRLMALRGAELIAIPAAFNMTTGPAHWEHIIRTRAVDNQVYLAAVSPTRDYNASYVAYGNSMLADPWGTVVARADEEEAIVMGEIDLEKITGIREQLPLLKHRRDEVYRIEEL